MTQTPCAGELCFPRERRTVWWDGALGMTTSWLMLCCTPSPQRQGSSVAESMSDDPILDAAHAQVMAVGVRRATLTDIASRAGVSRMTVYRRYPDVRTVLQALMTREFAKLIAQADSEAQTAGGDGRRRVVATAVQLGDLLLATVNVARMLDVDPELLLPYVTERVGAFQKLVIDGLAARLGEAMDEGTVRRADPRRLAAAMELAMRGYVLSAHADAPEEERAHREDLRTMLDAFLAP